MSNLVIKERSVWQSGMGIAGIVVLSLILAFAIFEFGRYRAGYNALDAAEAVSALNEEIAGLKRKQTTLREKSVVLDRSGQIERQAYKQLDGAVTSLQDEILELKEELAFYRGIISPKDTSKGLKMQDFELSLGIMPRNYHFKVVLTQILNNRNLARGNLLFEVVGVLKGEQKSYTLDKLSDSKGKGPAFRFKYFQILEGDFMLPEGFEPIKVNLTVKPKTSAHKKLTQAFDWVVREKN